MPLSWNEIRDRAIGFSKEWESETSERAEAQSFWNDFFQVFGINRKRVAVFEKQVEISRAKRKLKNGRIDAFWKGILLIEHKSAGSNLDKAFSQATDYFDGIPERDLPGHILVSDFQRFRLYDLLNDRQWDFALKDLPKHIKRFGFIAGYAPQEIKAQDPVNIRAAEKMGRLHDRLKGSGYAGHDLEVLLVRLVFCLFADDTGIFPKQSFRDWVENRTSEDGSDLGPQLALLFQVLNTPKDKRQSNLDEQIAAFEYINGKLFEESLHVAAFDGKMRAALLDCCALDWGAVSPAIFGALFQSIMDEKARRNLGAHYTSEENILKLIKPLFLDDLWAEFNRVKGNKNRIFEFHKKLRTLNFLDPACGCGNFLVITYRELRLLELEILRAVHSGPGSRFLNIHQELQLDVDQFYGIELEEFPAQIAQVALWLIDHQMNQKVSEEFGLYFARIPLQTSPHIVIGNALQLDWSMIIPKERLSYVMGNPPFIGHHYQNERQKAELVNTLEHVSAAGVMDYVSGWFYKAAKLIGETSIKVAFVSTNSITQGEQVGLLWGPLLHRFGIKIHFAHRTFRWSNEARGVAAVHCVIIGFASFDIENKRLFDYEKVDAEPHELRVRNISPYLTPSEDIVLENRAAPICTVPEIRWGSKPTDGGHFILSEKEKDDLLATEPDARRFVRQYMGSDEFLNGEKRWCLWLVDITPTELQALKQVRARVEAVKTFRLASKAESTRKAASFPTLFRQIAQPKDSYLLIPEVSSERRKYIPIGFMEPSVIASNLVFTVPGASLYHFGILSSAMHMAWVRQVCGRLKSDFRYSKTIVYNNFPWPDVEEKHESAISGAAKQVLVARSKFASSSLAALYDPLAMPPDLTRAHDKLDAAVDAAYGKKTLSSDADRLGLLFQLYRKYTTLLSEGRAAPKRKSV